MAVADSVPSPQSQDVVHNVPRRNLMRLALVLFLTGILLGCGGTSSYHRGAGIDQKPMYGGFDRKADPSLNKADEEFIANVTKEFGSQEKACQMFVEQGVRYYQRNNYSMACQS